MNSEISITFDQIVDVCLFLDIDIHTLEIVSDQSNTLSFYTNKNGTKQLEFIFDPYASDKLCIIIDKIPCETYKYAIDFIQKILNHKRTGE